MRRLCSLGLIAGLCSAPAEAAQVRFQGEFVFTDATAQCGGNSPVGATGRVRFRPQLAGTDNGTGAGFALYSHRSLDAFRLSTGNFTSAFKSVEALGTGDEWGTYTASARFTSVTTVPAGGISSASTFINVVGQISKGADVPGCIATFRLALTKRLE